MKPWQVLRQICGVGLCMQDQRKMSVEGLGRISWKDVLLGHPLSVLFKTCREHQTRSLESKSLQVPRKTLTVLRHLREDLLRAPAARCMSRTSWWDLLGRSVRLISGQDLLAEESFGKRTHDRILYILKFIVRIHMTSCKRILAGPVLRRGSSHRAAARAIRTT